MRGACEAVTVITAPDGESTTEHVQTCVNFLIICQPPFHPHELSPEIVTPDDLTRMNSVPNQPAYSRKTGHVIVEP